MSSIICVKNLQKTYDNDFEALKKINLEIQAGEIFALLGPNGAGKTTLISSICGLTKITSGNVQIDGADIIENYKQTRSLIGLVPQELSVEAFETVWATVSFSRGLFGKKANPQLIEKILKDLSLWDKRNNKIMTLSGGMKRRVMIAKALSHEPKVLFLDEPTAGVDVELRKDMWQLVHRLRDSGVTIILTTHYIEEAEEMADRVGVILKGELIVVEEKQKMMKRLGQRKLIVEMSSAVTTVPEVLQKYSFEKEANTLHIAYDSQDESKNIKSLIQDIESSGLEYKELTTKQSSLEDIFVELVNR